MRFEFTLNEDSAKNIGWWLAELASLGFNLKNSKIKELNEVRILRNITENVKKSLYEEYKLSITVICKEKEDAAGSCS